MEDLPDLNTNELAEDASVDDLRAQDPLSWRLSDVDTQVASKGWQQKFNIRMVVQVGLSIFYAIVYGLSFAGLNGYYEWPLPSDSTSTTTGYTNVEIRAILTNEEQFDCEDKAFYLNETGPLLSESNVSYGSSTFDLLQSMGFYWGISIAFFVAFAIARIYSGKYNQLLLLVKFKEDKKDGILKPAKMSFAYTIMCNAKSFSNVVFKDLCDRMASPEDTDWLSITFIFAWALIMLWILFWIFTCGHCCGFLQNCEVPYLGLCVLTSERQFLCFRVLVICNTIIMFVTWIVNFNPSLQFNPEMPVLYFTNVVSWIDLVLSIIGDIYLKFPSCDCCSPNSRATTSDEESPNAKNEGNSSGKTPPSSHHTAKTSCKNKREEESSSMHPVKETVQETIYLDGTRLSVKTMVYPDGSKKVVETTERPS